MLRREQYNTMGLTTSVTKKMESQVHDVNESILSYHMIE